jgi:N-acetylmuramate 1-kinase
MPQRLEQLKTWLAGEAGLPACEINPASGDASFRRYFRVTLPDGSSRIAMDAPPEREDCRPFVRVARTLRDLGLNAPEIHAEDLEQGFLLLDDLGTCLYLDALRDPQAVERLYGDALGALVALQACGPRQGLPPYDRHLLLAEMALFRDWLLGEKLRLELTAAEASLLETVFAQLADNALEQPQVCVHRDYHSRNLMVTPAPNPGILDFQDAVIGPVTYDLVSLLRDCYIRWPRQRVEEWALGYFHLAVQSGVLRPEDEGRFLRWFDLMGIQRHLKAAGIFARLDRRDGKPGYLKDIPRTLGYIVEVADGYPELAPLGRFVAERVLPQTRGFG